MKKTVGLIDKLLALAHGKALPASQLKGDWFDDMQEDGILITISHGSRRCLRASDEGSLRRYLSGRQGIDDLEKCREMLFDKDAARSTQVEITGDSKFVQQRTFKGFLVNSFTPVNAVLHDEQFVISPHIGTFVFISDYEDFSVSPDVVIVGIENAENFRFIHRQRSLFMQHVPEDVDILFVSRYPQSGDLIKWLRSIHNRYIHFGDLDLAGVNIYLTEYHQYLGDKSSFLIPNDYEERLQQGSLDRYNSQYQKYRNMNITDPRVKPLIDSIHKYHRGYDQEGFIE